VAMIFLIPKLTQKAGEKKSYDDTIKKAIAVMPVSNFTGNPDLDYIASGIQDALCGQLGQLSNLIVRPRASTLQFKDSEEPVQQIAKKLSVNNIVESSIKGTEDNLQIEVKLIEAFPGEKYIWASVFNQDWTSITNTYSEIVRRIMDGIQIKILPQDENKLAKKKGQSRNT